MTSSCAVSPRRSSKLRQGPPRARHGRRRRGHLPAADWTSSTPHVRDAVAKGAKVLTGGHVTRDRAAASTSRPCWSTSTTRWTCMREETFGPVLPIMRSPTSMRRCAWRTTPTYGLQASVWTRDTRARRGDRAAAGGGRRLRQRRPDQLLRAQPADGRLEGLGLGSRHGAGGIRKYCRVQSLLVSGFGPRRELFMFPYSARVTACCGASTARCTGAADTAADSPVRRLSERRPALAPEPYLLPTCDKSRPTC